MNKILIVAAMVILCMHKGLYAQSESYYSELSRMSKANQTFNAWEGFINIRDFVTLKEGRLILELGDSRDYEDFRNLDSILLELRKDIGFYKDSLAANPTGNCRIDFCYSPGFQFKKIRFKSYSPEGTMFLNVKGDISKLKFEQDTVRIIIQKSKPGKGGPANAGCMIPYSIQATFLLDNYYDIDKVIADSVLRGIVDTLEKSTPAKRHKNIIDIHLPFSIVYNPYYSGEDALKVNDRLMKNEFDYPYRSRKRNYFSGNFNLGEGIVMNTLTPMAELGLQYNTKTQFDHNIYSLSASPYLFFAKNTQGNTKVSDNWFVNLDIGTLEDKNQNGWFGREGTFGVGYLVSQNGGYFKRSTFKIFTDLQFVKGFTIVPEIIFTDNTRQIFPGFTLKVF